MNIIFLFLIPLIIEGLGLFQNHNVVLFYYLILQFILLIKNKIPIYIPIKISIIYLSFLLFLTISTFNYSVELENSYSLLLFCLSQYLLFVYIYNNKEKGCNISLKSVIFCLSIFITFYILKFIPYFQQLLDLFPKNEFNLFFDPSNFNHNHLGDFAGMGLLIALDYYFKKRDRITIPIILGLLILIITSLSRSAYIATTFSLIFYIFQNKINIRKKLNYLALIMVMLFVFVSMNILLTRGYDNKNKATSLLIKISEMANIPRKELLNSRYESINQAIKSFLLYPLFGVGSGNFYYASKMQRNNYMYTSNSSFNIFLDILVENGIIVFIFFSAYVYLLLKSIVKTKSIFVVLFIYLFINFQTDYTFKIYSIFTLFTILAGTLYTETEITTKLITFIIRLFSIVLFIIGLSLFISYLLMDINPKTSLIFNPINSQAYELLIQNSISVGNMKQAQIYARKYEEVSPNSIQMMLTNANVYENAGNKLKALYYYKRMYVFDNNIPFSIIEKIYFLEDKLHSRESAHEFITDVIYEYQRHLNNWQIETYYKIVVDDFCIRYQESVCKEMNW